ncbi:hypothetical protein ACSFBM_00185 [Variovorax sp. GB1R11]
MFVIEAWWALGKIAFDRLEVVRSDASSWLCFGAAATDRACMPHCTFVH